MIIARAWHRIVASVRGVTGMPDYDASLRHVRLVHPGRAPLTREQHFAQHVEQRYSGVSRCC